ncbi:nucleic acid-binding protein [Pelomyxa schiedti]|nr:nucleic acid-binding protein [Pelomyxa schiedti]
MKARARKGTAVAPKKPKSAQTATKTTGSKPVEVKLEDLSDDGCADETAPTRPHTQVAAEAKIAGSKRGPSEKADLTKPTTTPSSKTETTNKRRKVVSKKETATKHIHPLEIKQEEPLPTPQTTNTQIPLKSTALKKTSTPDAKPKEKSAATPKTASSTPKPKIKDEPESDSVDPVEERRSEEANPTPTVISSVGFEWGTQPSQPLTRATTVSAPTSVPQSKPTPAKNPARQSQPRQQTPPKPAKVDKLMISLKKKEAKLAREKHEEDVSRREIELANQKAPETAADFDRVLLGSPSSSFIWIKYMAFWVSMGEIDKARTVARRALKRIMVTEEKEKYNVWIAWINLEVKYGTPLTLENVVTQAAQESNGKLIYQQLAFIQEHSGHTDLAEEAYKKLITKYSQCGKVWVKYGTFLLKNGSHVQQQQLLTKALNTLPKKKHLKVIEKFAIMEFKYGSPERGRTIFEGIISNYPRRIDVWSVYIDMEKMKGTPATIRNLFERAIMLKLSPFKMKFFFKKYLEYEKVNGTPETIQKVKDAAIAFVRSKMLVAP